MAFSRVTARSFSVAGHKSMPSRSIALCCPGFRSGWRFHSRIYPGRERLLHYGCFRKSGFPFSFEEGKPTHLAAMSEGKGLSGRDTENV